MTVSPRHDTRFATVALLASATGVLFFAFGRSRDNAAAAPPVEVAAAPVQNVKAQLTGYLVQRAYTEEPL
jgi:hypothetical protein